MCDPGTPQHIAERAEDNLVPRGNGVSPIEHFQRRHTYGATGTVYEFDTFRQNFIDPIFDNGMRLAAAHLHNSPGPGGGSVNGIGKLALLPCHGIRRGIS